MLSTLACTVKCLGSGGERSVALSDFIKDAYTTALSHDELVAEISVKMPPAQSGGAYLAFKRAAPVYPTASAAVQLTIEGEICKEAAITLGCVGLTAIRASEAENGLRGATLNARVIDAAAEVARAAADPQPDMRGSAEYKRQLVGALVKQALGLAIRRARGERLEASHIYA